ncbi:MAG: hypothetical protein ACTSQP_20050 [Promethearchaeota archaeon]
MTLSYEAFKAVVKNFEVIIRRGYVFIVITIVKIVFVHSKPFLRDLIELRKRDIKLKRSDERSYLFSYFLSCFIRLPENPPNLLKDSKNSLRCSDQVKNGSIIHDTSDYPV